MDQIIIPKVQQVFCEVHQNPHNVKICTLHLLMHDLYLQFQDQTELSIPYEMIYLMDKQPAQPPSLSQQQIKYNHGIQIFTRHFLTVKLFFQKDLEYAQVFQSLQSLMLTGQLEKLKAFHYQPKFPFTQESVIDLVKDFQRLGVGSNGWRLSEVNKDYQISPTYPQIICVPEKISDAVLFHAAKFRSRARLPAMTFFYQPKKCSITRSSQPLVGIQSKRSIQDEKLIEAIFENQTDPSLNLIVDARPLGNAMANRAMGAGTESMENYKNCQRLFMGIENIHVMRDSLDKLEEACLQPDLGIDRWLNLLENSHWLKHLKAILESALVIVQTIQKGGNVLIHCSDGWDRTAQLSSLASLCLDPYYRTFEGFKIIIEKEWLSFGHKFSERCGHLVRHPSSQPKPSLSSKDEKETSPVFLQFLECVRLIMLQFPTEFEFNENLLIELYYSIFNCQFGTFLLNNQRERAENQIREKTKNFWALVDENPEDFLNLFYIKKSMEQSHNRVLLFSTQNPQITFWHALYTRFEDEVWGGTLFIDPTQTNQYQQLISKQIIPNPYKRRSLFKNHTQWILEKKQRLLQLKQSNELLDHHLSAYQNIDLKDIETETEEEKQPSLHSILEPKKLSCSNCHVLFSTSDQQWWCFWCGQVVCWSCCRYSMTLKEVLGQESDSSLSKYRACDSCYGRVYKTKIKK